MGTDRKIDEVVNTEKKTEKENTQRVSEYRTRAGSDFYGSARKGCAQEGSFLSTDYQQNVYKCQFFRPVDKSV